MHFVLLPKILKRHCFSSFSDKKAQSPFLLNFFLKNSTSSIDLFELSVFGKVNKMKSKENDFIPSSVL